MRTANSGRFWIDETLRGAPDGVPTCRTSFLTFARASPGLEEIAVFVFRHEGLEFTPNETSRQVLPVRHSPSSNRNQIKEFRPADILSDDKTVEQTLTGIGLTRTEACSILCGQWSLFL